MEYDIKDLSLAPEGALRTEWAGREMPVLSSIRERFAREQSLRGVKIAGCLHITSETANLAETLQAGGAEVVLCASNPLSTQDDIAAYLVQSGIPVFAIKGEDSETYHRHIDAAVKSGPQITIDDGADLVAALHSSHPEELESVMGAWRRRPPA